MSDPKKKKCRHQLDPLECWLCLGNPRSEEARGFAESSYGNDLLAVFTRNEREIFVNEEAWEEILEHGGGLEEDPA